MPSGQQTGDRGMRRRGQFDHKEMAKRDDRPPCLTGSASRDGWIRHCTGGHITVTPRRSPSWGRTC